VEVAVVYLRHYFDIYLEEMAESILDSLLHDRNSNQNVRRKRSSNYMTVMFGAVLLLSRRCTYRGVLISP